MIRIAKLKTVIPPKRYSEIPHRLDSNLWLEAYMKEVNNLEKIGQIEVVPRPFSNQVIPILELFCWKHDNFLNTKLAKIRIVARGDQ